jgi:hypothetical protein
VKPLEPPDSHRLPAAQDWLELGNHVEADRELDEITPQLRAHPDVLEVRWGIYAHAKKWDACVDIAAVIIKLAPEQPDGWLHRAFTLHELKRTQEARDLLLPVVDQFPDEPHLRNDLIFADYQTNWNLFVDHPEWVDLTFSSPCTNPPVLDLAVAGPSLSLSWLATNQSTRLEWTTNLPASWTDAVAVPVLTNGRSRVLWTNPGPRTFFRLRAW